MFTRQESNAQIICIAIRIPARQTGQVQAEMSEDKDRCIDSGQRSEIPNVDIRLMLGLKKENDIIK